MSNTRFDGAAFLRHAKRVRIRPTPYELQSAAQQCAEMAARSGWLDVRVEELLAAEVAQRPGLL